MVTRQRRDAEMLKGRTGLLVGMAVMSVMSMTACSTTGTSGTPQAAVNKGTVPLEAVKVGTPETVFKEALITFIPDSLGTNNDKTQYLSRFTDADGGQYVVQTKNDISFEVAIVHRDKTLTKEQALSRVARLLPSNVKDQPVLAKTDKTGLAPVETYTIGKDYKGSLTYKDKGATEVSMVTVTRIAPDVASAPALIQ